MAQSNGIPGLAVACVAAGSLLVYAGIQDIPVLDALRQIVRGKVPVGGGDPYAAAGTVPKTSTDPAWAAYRAGERA